MITASVDSKAALMALNGFMARADISSDRAVLDVAYEVMRLSQFEVPHAEGTLQNSGTVEQLANSEVILGYHTKYAARLHEHPEYRFKGGRKGKYIEDPVVKNADVLGIKYARGVQTRLF